MSIDWRYPPRPSDPSLRMRQYGRIQPMPIERTASTRQRLAIAAALLASVLLLLGIAQAI